MDAFEYVPQSEFDVPEYQGPVERVPRLEHPSTRYPTMRDTGMGFFVVDDIIGLIISILATVKKVIDFIKALIKGKLLNILMGIASFVLPVFNDIIKLTGLDTLLGPLVGAVSDVVNTLVGPLKDTLSVLPTEELAHVTKLDVFDSLSVAKKLSPEDIASFAISETTDIPADPEQWLDKKLDEKTEAAVANAIDSTPLGQTVNEINNLGSQVPESPSDLLADAGSSVQSQLEEKKGIATGIATQGAGIATSAFSDAENKLAAQGRNLEQTMAAKVAAGKDLLKPPKLSMDDVFGFLSQFLKPGQKFSDLSADEQAMLRNKLKAEYPGFVFPPFDFSTLDAYPAKKRRGQLMFAGAAGVSALLLIFGRGE